MQIHWLLRISEKYKQTEATDDFVLWSQISKNGWSKTTEGLFFIFFLRVQEFKRELKGWTKVNLFFPFFIFTPFTSRICNINLLSFKKGGSKLSQIFATCFWDLHFKMQGNFFFFVKNKVWCAERGIQRGDFGVLWVGVCVNFLHVKYNWHVFCNVSDVHVCVYIYICAKRTLVLHTHSHPPRADCNNSNPTPLFIDTRGQSESACSPSSFNASVLKRYKSLWRDVRWIGELSKKEGIGSVESGGGVGGYERGICKIWMVEF